MRNLKSLMKYFTFISFCLLAFSILAEGIEPQDIKLIRRLGIGTVYSVDWSLDGNLIAAGAGTEVHILDAQRT